MKKFNIFLIMLLLISQSVLGPIGMVSASADTSITESNSANVDSDSSEVNVDSDGSEVNVDSDGSEVNADSDGSEVNVDSDGSEVNVDSDGSEVNADSDGSEANVDSDGGEANLNPEDFEHEKTDQSLLNRNEEIATGVTMSFVGLKIGNDLVAKDGDVYELPTLGTDTTVSYKFDIIPDGDYGAGSYFTFQLPRALIVFNDGALSGNSPDGAINKYSYTTDGNGKVTVQFDDELEKEQPLTITFNFGAEFSGHLNNDDFEQEIIIPIEGSEDISLNLVFKPKTLGAKMSKSGVASSENGEKYIDWKINVNHEGADLIDAEVRDALNDADYELEGSISIKKIPVGLNGLGNEVTPTKTSVPNFPVTLDNGRFAYELSFRTKIVRNITKDKEQFSNTAEFYNNGGILDTGSDTVKITYGTPLSKELLDGSTKYKANWEIKYNYLGAPIDNGKATISDTIVGAHAIVDNSTIKIYTVNVDINGEEIGDLVEVTSYYNPASTSSGKKLDINFGADAENGQAFKIIYTTESTSEFIIKGTKVINTVTSPNITPAEKELPLTENIFTKSKVVNHGAGDSTITWTLTINADKEMKKLVIDDVFQLTGGDSRQTLIKGMPGDKYFAISNNSEVTETITDARLGYKLEFKNPIPVGTSITVIYKTRMDVDSSGATYEYGNTATITWDGASSTGNEIVKSALYKPVDTPMGKNGYKSLDNIRTYGFDHVNQVFNWELAVNISKQNINGAKVVDTVGSGHEVVKLEEIKVYLLNLNDDNDIGESGTELTKESGWTLSEDSTVQKFTINFSGLPDGAKKQAYIIKYQTKDSDTVIGNVDGNTKKSNEYVNNALFTIDGKDYPFEAKGKIRFANELIDKSATTNAEDETITWKVNINKSHSILGNITLTDKPSANQMLLKDTFIKREILRSIDGGFTISDIKIPIPSEDIKDNEDGSFSIELGNFDQKGYQIEYKTFFLGGSGDKFSNTASINFTGANSDVKTDAGGLPIVFNFNTSDTDITSTMGSFTLHKVKINPLTGKTGNFDGIVFERWNKKGNIKLDEATTNLQGMVEFKKIRYGNYTIKEKVTPTGYKILENFNVLLNAATDTSRVGKLIPVENIEDVDMTNLCPLFTLTIRGLDGKPVTAGKSVTLTNKVTDKVIDSNDTGNTGANGEITLDPEKVKAGVYAVTIDIEGTPIDLGDIQVNYDKNADANCIGEVVPLTVCPNFTLTINNSSNKPRANIEKVTIKDHNGNEVEGIDSDGKPTTTFKTNATGQITFPYVIEKGTYRVYEGTKLINSFTVKDTCEAIVKPKPIPPTPAPTCDLFTIIVKQNDVIAGADVELVIKSGDTEIAKGTTDSEGNIVFAKGDLPEGKYTAYDKDGNEAGKITVSYEYDQTKDECQAAVNMIADTKTCDVFTVTVKENGKAVDKDVVLTVKNKDDKIVTTGMTNKDGVIEFEESNLPDGEYTVHDEDGNKIGSITVSYDGNCEAEFNLTSTPNACDAFTITVKESGEIVQADVALILKDVSGTTVATGKTNANGKIEFTKEDLPEGIYTAQDINGSVVGTITVSFDVGECSAVVDLEVKVCDFFMITILDRPNTLLIVKDITNTTIAIVTTNNDGIATISNVLIGGKYRVYIKHDLVAEIIATDSCEVTFIAGTPGTPPVNPGEPDKPTEPDKPGEKEPGKPTEPGKPGEEDSGKPSEPGKPGEENPNKPTEPDKPGEEEPGKPSEPDKPGEEDSDKPTEPGKPGEEDPSKPTEPGKPDEEDSGKPTESGKPGEEKPGDNSGDSNTPGTPSGPGTPTKPTGPNAGTGSSKPGSSTGTTGSKNPNLNLNSGPKLPQTGEAFPVIPMAAGMMLIILGLWLVFGLNNSRRKKLNL
ncbi:collagen binding domain-containing protein [Sporosarcina siberiensis]|uniref:Collagen binding domain-containing protein n=1 Tax=Sporosarcina siberiensis TaxID=1365606 RepID=A0ABW4SET8_9BACL